jgi:hypothetical protein
LKHTALFAAAAFAAFSWGAASAATYTTCDPTTADDVTNTVGCEISSESQDFLNTSPITVNLDGGFFDFADWVFGGKVGVDDDYDGDGEGLSGSFDLSSVAALIGKAVMVVFKDGAGTTLVGYMMSPGATTADWESPFHTPDFDVKNTKEVSHISVYYRECAQGSFGCPEDIVVPLPGALPLLAGGLIGAGAFLRRKSRKTA